MMFIFLIAFCSIPVLNGGVSGLSPWLQKRFSTAFTTIETHKPVATYDCVYVDINEHIHHQVRRATSSEELVQLVLKRVKSLLRSTKPRRLVVLAVDGPGPLAKVLVQRQRRRKDAAKSARKDAAAGGGSGTGAGGLDKLALTPGAPFMLLLSDALEAWARERISTTVSYVVSGAHVAGEGEVKCLGHLLEATREASTTAVSSSSRELKSWPLTHVLHGGDSDLLLMALAAGTFTHIQYTHFMHPTPSTHPIISTQHIFSHTLRLAADVAHVSVLPYDRPTLMFSADQCRKALAQILPSNGATGRRALDLVCLAVLCSGNDYIPAMPSAPLDTVTHPT